MMEQDFYNVYSYSDSLKPGDEIRIQHSLSFCQERADLTDLTALSAAELGAMKEASAKQEQAIFEKLCHAVEEWEHQGANTLRIAKALEYARTLEVTHTSNVWKKGEYDWYEISNMVYKMIYRIYENTRYDHKLKEQVVTSWEVSWYVEFNQPRNPDYTSQSAHIAGQDRKRYTDKAAMEKYIQGRKDAYADLFTQLSPPIPSGQRGRFCVNGQLLPGYTVEPEREAVVEELLDYLEDGDLTAAELAQEKPVGKPHAKPHTKQKTQKTPGR